MIEISSLADKSSAELSNMMAEAEKAMVDRAKELSTITVGKNMLQREKITLMGKIKDLEIVEEKARQLVRESRADFDFIKNAFFRAKNVEIL